MLNSACDRDCPSDVADVAEYYEEPAVLYVGDEAGAMRGILDLMRCPL